MEEKENGIAWKLKLFITCVSYDIKSALLWVKIKYTRLKIKIAKKALEYLKKDG